MSVKITVEIDGIESVLYGEPKVFSTGSKGFYTQGKVQGANGDRYQGGFQLVLIGSKPVKKGK